MIKELLKTPLGQFRIIAFLEGCSFLLIGLTMILKYKYNMPKPNYIVGMAHGVLFIAYVYYAIMVGTNKKWGFIKIGFALLASLIPFGTFIADKKLFRDS